MESTISAILGVTKYANAPGEIGVSRGPTPQIGPVMLHHSTPPDTAIKTCIRCGQTKSTTEFFANPRSRGGLRGHCKACHYRDNPPHSRWHVIAIGLRKRNGSSPKEADLRKALGDPRECYLCGEALTWETGSIDHVTPVSRGGTSDPSNLRWAHRGCNRAKSDLTLEEFVSLARRIVDEQEKGSDGC